MNTSVANERFRILAGSMSRQSEAGMIGLLVVATVLASIFIPTFRTTSNASEILNNSSLLIIVAVGQAVVIVTRQIDLSVGAILGLSAYLVGSTAGHSGLGNPLLDFFLALALGALLGLFNAALIHVVEMPAIIATLATLSIYSGLQVVATHGTQLYASQLPKWLADIPSSSWLGLSPLIWIAFATVVIVSYLMRATRWGRDLYAMGSNPEAARHVGISIGRRTYQAFAMSGALAGVGGLLYAGQYGNVDATAGAGFELAVIAAAVIGGVSLFGGSGTPFGAGLGAVLLIEIENILASLRVSVFAQQTLEGVAIITAVALYAIVSRRLRKPSRQNLAPEEGTAAEEKFISNSAPGKEMGLS